MNTSECEIDQAAERERELRRLQERLWVIQASAGDRDAFARLVELYQRPLVYYLRRFVLEPSAALDLHQEVWLDAFRGIAHLRAPEAFRVWIYQLARRKAARFFQQRLSGLADLDSADVSEIPLESAETPVDAEAVHHALGQIDPGAREVLTLHYLRDLSLEELAAVIEIPVGTVKSRLHHARRALRRVLERTK